MLDENSLYEMKKTMVDIDKALHKYDKTFIVFLDKNYSLYEFLNDEGIKVSGINKASFNKYYAVLEQIKKVCNNSENVDFLHLEAEGYREEIALVNFFRNYSQAMACCIAYFKKLQGQNKALIDTILRYKLSEKYESLTGIKLDDAQF